MNQEESDILLIQKVIGMLKSSPEKFSARWFTRIHLNKSVQSSCQKYLIMIEDGQIMTPFEPVMTKAQKQEIKLLVAPIVQKDKMALI